MILLPFASNWALASYRRPAPGYRMLQREVGRTNLAAAAEVDELHLQVALRAEDQVAWLDVQVVDANFAVLGLHALANGAEEAPELEGVEGGG